MTEKHAEKQVNGKLEYPKSPTGHSPQVYVHIMKSCEHKWDGPLVITENSSSVSCSKCGVAAIDSAEIWD